MARAAFVSPDHKHLAEPFYLRARCYLEADEQKGEGEYFISLAHAQCCILLSHFEVRNLWFSRSSMSTSKAVRLSQILGLHQLDNRDNSNRSMTLPPPKDWCEQEERRRTLWAIYCGDKNTSGTTGWPSLMDVKRISALVPASEEAFQLGIEEPSVTLSHLLNGDDKICRASPFACRIIAAHLFHECLERTYQDIQDPDPDPADIHNGDFYKHHDVLDPGLTTAYVTLPDTLHTSQHSQEAITTNLQRHTASIFIHRIGSAQAKKHNIPVEILAGTRARLPPAADAIFDIIASLANVSTMFRNPVVSFAAYVAAYVFLEDYTNTQNRDSEMKVTGITDLMITIGHEDPVTAAGAVQLAFQLRRHGIDPSAVNKVQGLMAKMGLKGPVMGWHKYEEEVVFCPFEVPWGPAPPVLRSEHT
ncbi:hypothetical protein NW762_013608 [Fusarium torreyae]|uniref:Xylanolytic transcriptional activator regulatory domain-containing protein n=1 Tax=Fusarium torreyae TaxID=1237075 RepID=A0A9W8RK64_9HYPO|nr:hypothetical protein NW762_013608 [Fusarium torreyae]